MSVTLKQLAREVGGSVLGDGEVEIRSLDAMEDATDRSICPLFRQRMLLSAPMLPAAVLATKRLARFALQRGVPGGLIHEAPQAALAGLIDRFHPTLPVSAGIHERAVVHPSANLHPTARVAAVAVIEEEVSIGAESVIGPGAVICRGSRLGERVRVGPGAVIGYEGFGFVPLPDGVVKVRQVGRVVIEDNVEIGANTCIDRGTLGTTRIGRGTKIDNLVQIGHNTRVGEEVLMAGQAGVAGSCTVERRVLLGGQAGIADHLTIGEGAKVAAKSGVTRSVKPQEAVAGYPAMPRVKWQKAMANLAHSSIVKPRDAAYTEGLMSKKKTQITIDDIVTMLPHKPPATMVDSVEELEPGKRIIARKNVSISDPCFLGHFPGHPSMPVSTMLEIMIQTSCLLAMYTESYPPASKVVAVVGLSDAKFHRMIRPGESLRITAAIGQRHSNNWRFHSEVFVDDLIVAEALLSLSLVDRDDTL